MPGKMIVPGEEIKDFLHVGLPEAVLFFDRKRSWIMQLLRQVGLGPAFAADDGRRR